MEETKTSKKEESLAELEVKIRRRVACEERAHKIVLSLIENPISREYLLDVANNIHVTHYVDVTEERAIESLCGYPLCPNPLPKQPKQKYHISTKYNKVYDVTERKNFCSNQCYKASKYLEKQISTTAVWAREKEPPVQFDLLPTDAASNKGSIGEDVLTNPASEIKQEVHLVDQVSSLLQEDETGEDSGNESFQEAGATGGYPSPRKAPKNKSAPQEESEITIKDLAEQLSQDLLLDEETLEGGSIDQANSVIESSDSGKMNRLKINPSGTAKDSLQKSISGSVVKSDREKEKDLYEAACRNICNTQVKGVNMKENDPMVPVPHPEILNQGTQVKETIKTTIENKTRLLMDLIDKRECLRTQLKQSEHQKDSPARKPSPNVNPDLCSSEIQTGKPNPAHYSLPMTESSFKSDQELLQNKVKVRASSVMENIRRIANQQSTNSKPAKQKVTTYPGVSPLDPIRQALFEWKTAETVNYFSKQETSDPSPMDESDFQYKYAALGRRIESHDISNLLGEEKWEEEKENVKRLPDYKHLERDTLQQDLKVREYFKGTLKYPVLSTEELDEDDIDLPPGFRPEIKSENKEPVREPVLPLVDAHSQMAIRRKLVLDKLNKTLPDLLQPLRLTMIDITSDLKDMVHTFNFTATNILFKPQESILLGYVLLHLLAVKNRPLQSALGGEESASVYRRIMESAGVSQTDIDSITNFMISQ